MEREFIHDESVYKIRVVTVKGWNEKGSQVNEFSGFVFLIVSKGRVLLGEWIVVLGEDIWRG